MKLDKSIMEQFKLDPVEEKEPINVVKISDALDFMKECSDRLIKKSNLYVSTDDADVQADCIDIVIARLNDFTQVFKDIVIFLREKEGTHKQGLDSLRYCVTSYDTYGFDKSDEEKNFLSELLLRNEITHDYFNREIHQMKLIKLMRNFIAGAQDVYLNLYGYCKDKGLLDEYLDRNRK